jgi:hypothetical protein
MKVSYYLSATFLLFFVSSCQQDDTTTLHPPEGKGKEVRFTLWQNKASQAGSFDMGDSIGVYATRHGEADNQVASNVKYVYNGEHFEAEHPILYKGVPLDFYVYYPYRAANGDAGAIAHAITQQATAGGRQASDFLTAINTTGLEEGDIPLSFQHKYATIRFGAEEIPGLTGCTMGGVKTHTRLDFSQNIAVPEAAVGDIEMFDRGVSAGVRLYEATVPAQDMQGVVFILGKATGETIRCPVSEPLILEEGKMHYLGVELMRTIAFGSYPAFMGSPTGEGSYIFAESCTLKGEPAAGYHFTGWYENNAKVSADTVYTFQVTADRVLTPAYRSDTLWGEWNLSLSAYPLTLPREGGSSVITAACRREVYLKGSLWKTESLTPSLSIDNSAFTLSGATLSVGGNPVNAPARSCTVTATAAGKTQTATITQNRGVVETSSTDYEISVSPGSYTFSRDGGSYTFSVDCYRVTYVYHDGVHYSTNRSPYTGYSTYTEGEGFSRSGRTVYADRNSASSSRSGRFVVTAGGASGGADLYQESGVAVTYGYGYEISVSPLSHTFSRDGESKAFTVSCYYCTYTYHDGALYSTSRTPYTGYSTSVTGSGFSLSGNTVTAARNTGAARQGTFRAVAGDVSATATLSQEAARQMHIETEIQ